ncbi:MAG: helix-turn-helix domain-containing protein [Methanothrix sp.]|nr:helix-turn-helix domain-containing protein [Methanothrix sp.]
MNESDENKPLELAENEEGLIQSNDIKPFYLPSPYPEGYAEEASKKEIEVTSEMKAVMETLTPRERAILEALIKAGGRITQSDLRHETGTPRSSLSGILLSLERRKIIIKDKSGCTNVIELSDWFSSKKERY